MPEIIVNDERMEAEHGELLLTVARRHAAHIGFFCDGRGFCSTCRCRVVSGAEQLSPVTDAEYRLLTPIQLQEGYRLGCQAAVEGSGVEAIARVEELRRSTGYGLAAFVGNIANQAVYQLSLFPGIIPTSVSRFVGSPPSPQHLMAYGGDLFRIIRRRLTSRPVDDWQR